MGKNAIAIIQARMTSTRLPGKVTKEIVGIPMLGHVIERLKKSRLVDEIVIATTKNKSKPILEIAQNYNVESFSGSKDDVLDRYYQAVKKYKAEPIVRITSDCPLLDPEVVDKVIRYYMERKDSLDYVTNTLTRSYPRGLDTEVFSFSALEKAWREAKEVYQREHVTPYIYEHTEIFRLANVENNEDLSYMRWTVDEEKDLEFVREVYKRLYKEGEVFLMQDVLNLLKKEPQLMETNKEAKQKKLGE